MGPRAGFGAEAPSETGGAGADLCGSGEVAVRCRVGHRKNLPQVKAPLVDLYEMRHERCGDATALADQRQGGGKNFGVREVNEHHEIGITRGFFGLPEAPQTCLRALDQRASRLGLRTPLCACPARRKRYCFGDQRNFRAWAQKPVNKIVKSTNFFSLIFTTPRARLESRAHRTTWRIAISSTLIQGRARSAAAGLGRGSRPCEVNDSSVSRAVAASAMATTPLSRTRQQPAVPSVPRHLGRLQTLLLSVRDTHPQDAAPPHYKLAPSPSPSTISAFCLEHGSAVATSRQPPGFSPTLTPP